MIKRLDDIEKWYDIGGAVSPDDFEWLIGQVRRMQEENERYKKALEFYEDESNYYPEFEDAFFSPVGQDEGQTAREALEAAK